MNPSTQFDQPVTGRLVNNLTERDFSDSMGPVAGSGGLYVQFFYMRVQIKSRNARTNGNFETRLCVAKQPKGDRSTIAAQPITEAEAQRQFPMEWARFKQYQDTPTAGTPLSELPGISQSQIMLLVLHGIRSIEDLVGLDETVVQNVGLDAVTARKIALKWTARKGSAGGDVDLARELSKQEIENATLRKRAEAMEASMAAMQAKIDAMAAMGAGGGMAAVAAAPAEDDDGLLEDLPDSEFGAGGDVATGNDDLIGEVDPLKG